MRIIAGACRSRRLQTPAGLDTRPTLDRVRETIFDILQFRVPGARVLDLYAGSGAMALESLSRGAAWAVMCDSAREAQRVIRGNAEALGLSGRCRLMPVTDEAALRRLADEGERFDLIFLDPPYRYDTQPVMAGILEKGLLAPDGIICVEYSGHEPGETEELSLFRERRIGTVGVRMFSQKKPDAPGDP